MFRLLKIRRGWADRFLAEPTTFGISDTCGVEPIHPTGVGCSPAQIGRKSCPNYRWIIDSKLCLLLSKLGLVVAWDCRTINVADSTLQPMVRQAQDEMSVFSDAAFHAKQGDPPNIKVCQPYHWNDRMLVETVLSMYTVVNHLRKVGHRAWEYFRTQIRLAFTLAAPNVLAQWHGLPADADGFVPLSAAEFSL